MTRTTGAAGIALTQSFETFSPTEYDDGYGNPTIGWGHRIQPGESFGTIDREEGDRIFRADLGGAEAIVTKAVKVALSQNQFDALVSFAFNVGPGRAGYKDGFVWLKNGHQSSLLRLLNGGNYVGAAQQFLYWDHANGKTSAGLARRRAAEKTLFLTPDA